MTERKFKIGDKIRMIKPFERSDVPYGSGVIEDLELNGLYTCRFPGWQEGWGDNFDHWTLPAGCLELVFSKGVETRFNKLRKSVEKDLA